MFSNKRSEEQNYSWSSIGLFEYEALQVIVENINYLSRGQWTYVKDEKDSGKTHFKLGKGTLDLEAIAMMTSSGALIDFQDNTYKIFKINMELLQKSCDAAKLELADVTNEQNPTLNTIIFTEEILSEMQAHEKKTGRCNFM